MFAVFFLHSETWAATFTVNNTSDDKRADGLSNNCYCKATTGYCTLRAAIETANKCVSTGTKSGNDFDNIVLTSGSAYNLKLGTLTITKGTVKIYVSSGKATINIGGQDRVFYVNGSTTLKLENIDLLNGHPKDAVSGGAIFNNGTLSLVKSSIKDSSSDLSGGAIYNVAGSTVTLSQSTIENNTAAKNGGAIYNSGTLTIDSSTIGPNNTATDENGGGIFNAGTAMISNSTISGNTSKLKGGGLYNSGTVTLKHVTISKNITTADVGGGGGIAAAVGSNFSIFNSIILDNSNESTANTVYYNCIGYFSGEGNIVHGGGCSFPNDKGKNTETSLPILKPLADNGGPTKTHALEAVTSAIDAADAGYMIDIDQRGYDRDTAGDIGAFEFSGTCGDGYLHKGKDEQCDDGNAVAGDGCSATCQLEPKIYLSESQLDFGYVAIGSEKSDTILLGNMLDNGSILKISSSTLKVDGASYSLPYSGVNFSAEVQTCDTYPIMPYMSYLDVSGCAIAVKFYPAVTGVLEAQLSIKSNDPKNPETLISLKGEGYEDVVAVSPLNIIFSDLKLYEAASQELVISNSGPNAISGGITNLGDFGIEYVSCNYASFFISSNDSCTFKVTIKPEEVKKYAITLKVTTNNPKYPEFNIPVEATVTPPIISIEPVDTLDFGKVVAGGIKDASITIKNEGSSKSYLSYSAPVSGAFYIINKCYDVPAMGSCETTIKFNTFFGKVGAFEDSFAIISQDPQNPTKTIKLAGVAVAPEIKVSTEKIDFGNVIIGEEKEAQFTILNVGTSDLTVSDIKFQDSETLSLSQSCMALPIVIQPNAVCDLKFKFMPVKEEIYDSVVGIYSNGPLGPPAFVNITGSGVKKPLPHLGVSSYKISINKAMVGKTAWGLITLSSSGDLPLVVTDVSISGEGFKLLPDDAAPCENLPVTLKPSEKCGFIVVFSPTAPVEYGGTLTIISDSDGVAGSKLEIPVKTMGLKPSPTLSASGKAINDFGEVQIDSVVSDKITISNISIFGGLAISEIDDVSDKENFSLVGKDACIGTDITQCEFGIEFHPKSGLRPYSWTV
jgi:cysteine-rich repeat protein/predicted outer membrane repeat protein